MPCIFCKGVHFNDSCDKFITVADRKGRLISQGRCFVCLKVGHICKECPCAQSRSCHYCKQVGHHHRSICPKHFTVSCNSDTNQAPSNINQASVNVNSSGAGQPATSKETNPNKPNDVNHVHLCWLHCCITHIINYVSHRKETLVLLPQPTISIFGQRNTPKMC